MHHIMTEFSSFFKFGQQRQDEAKGNGENTATNCEKAQEVRKPHEIY